MVARIRLGMTRGIGMWIVWARIVCVSVGSCLRGFISLLRSGRGRVAIGWPVIGVTKSGPQSLIKGQAMAPGVMRTI